MNKNTQIAELYSYGTTNTNDPQKAELEGIKRTTEMILHLGKYSQYNRFTILCDCLNAVNYIKGKYATPHKYHQVCQTILENIHQIKNNHIDINIEWIPGHTDNKWNDRADALAKYAAYTWVRAQPPIHRSLGHWLPRQFSPSRQGEAD